mgnify:CR=1 FL=1
MKNNREKVLANEREYFYKNKEGFKQYRRENAERINEYSKMWRKNNIKKTRMYSRQRNLKMKNLPNTLTEEEWGNTLREFEYSCVYCGEQSELEKDHFIPVSKDGGNTVDNILPACKKCNQSKWNYDFFEWYPTYKFYDKDREIHILNYLGYELN